ncbi:unnamed protein product [Rotaria sordida]|uniref:G-protein coupled receptors family 1 profile domain-containing protein n=1 Tax=Rotaria sordida TaxID=392033 RepID=A0A815NYY3_9BILA|nr:unnamed protein product [Rotaria sordida]CAF1132266.1 unnamed protein product [Rotaria sordida]CAF1199776.1 unnamed protein product [Rotaria sordida]CAF1288090.1 unnamed protein product [Rotaria sordida]CAF1441688.1 unnamed protein product [Rotaria sordida]
MDSITFSLLTSSINPLYSPKLSTTTSLALSSSPSATTITTLNGTGSAAELTKTLIPEKYQVILLSFAYGIISLLAVVGNSCIIYIVLRNRRMHSVTNYFICNLALADCLVACFATPFQFQAAALQKWVLPHFLCKLAPFVQILSVDVSIYTLVAVSLDRYHVMLHPLKPKLSTKSACIIFIIIWLVALGSSTPSLIFYNVYFIDDFGYQCLPNASDLQQNNNSTTKSYDIHKIYIVYNIYSQYVIPFIIISCAYFRIAAHLYFSKPVGQTKHQEVIARNKRKVLKMLFLVVALFLICWFPLQLYNFLNVYKPEINDFKHIVVLWLCANWLAMSNSCHNPFIYGFCSVKFNREFRKLFSCFPCIDATQLDTDLPNKNRVNVPLSTQHRSTALQLRRVNCQRRSPNSSPNLLQRKRWSHSNTTNNQVLSTTKGHRNEKHYNFFSNNNPSDHHHHHALFGNNNNNYYSTKKDRSITNCEKFLPDNDLINSTKENDLLLIHARQSTLFL